jgi:hypothetical protein
VDFKVGHDSDLWVEQCIIIRPEVFSLVLEDAVVRHGFITVPPPKGAREVSDEKGETLEGRQCLVTFLLLAHARYTGASHSCTSEA